MNETIQKALDMTKYILENYQTDGRKISCSISGGSDSDLCIDMCERTIPHFVDYVFF